MLLDPGTGTLKSVSYEAAFVEACQLLELAEEASTNPANVDFTDVSHNNNAKTFVVSVSLPIAVVIGSTGQPTFSATNHVTPTFTNGGADIKSTSLCGAVLEIAQNIQAYEKANSANPNNINIQYDTDAGTASITSTIPCVRSVTSTGTILTTATPYLV